MTVFVDGQANANNAIDRLRMRVGSALVSYGFQIAPDGLWRLFSHNLHRDRDKAGPRAVPLTETADLVAAIEEFERRLPDWWFSMGTCSVSRHASCAPDRNGRDHALLTLETRVFDEGFHADLSEGSLADALRDVMHQALDAKRAHDEGRLR